MFLCASMRLRKKALDTHQFLESSTAGRQSSLDMLRKSSARFMRSLQASCGYGWVQGIVGKSHLLFENCGRGLDVMRPRRAAHVFMPPLMCWYLGRQGSSAKGSWEKTESSPEEQELRVSGKLGEYCSTGEHRSRYSSLVANVSMRSKSSTNCLNVGL